jgi:hypothetical protein
LAFSFTLFLALILLFPGLCAWAVLRAADRTDLLTPRPDQPNSTSTLFIVVAGALAGHLLGATLLAVQAVACRQTSLCIGVGFDPNVYRVLFTVARGRPAVDDVAVAAWLFELTALGLLTGALMHLAARTGWIRDRWDAIDFGWLNPAVQAVRSGDAMVIAYVVTKTQHEGASIAYEGIVHQLALSEDQTISMLVLRRVDRFLLRIDGDRLARIDQPREPIAQVQFHLAEIANVALEVIAWPVAAVGADEGASP